MAGTSSIQKHTGPNGVTFLTIENLEERDAILRKLAPGSIMFFDTETTGLRVRSGEHHCRMIGLQFGELEEPWTSEVFCVRWDKQMQSLFFELVDLVSRVVAHGLRFDAHATGLPLPTKPDPTDKFFDTQMQVYFQDTSARKSLDDLSPSFNYPNKIKTPALIRNGRIDEVPILEAFEYLADDVKATSAIYYQVVGWGTADWVRDVDRPLEGVVQRMEQRGVLIIPDRLRKAQTVATTEADKLRKQLVLTSGDINYNSPKQMADLFLRKGWPTGTTKTGNPSTDSEVLGRLARQGNTFCEGLLKWRKFTKLNSTFFNPLLEMHKTSPTGFVHPSFNTMGPKTGRFSCSDPNLQQAANAHGDTSNLAWYVRASITHENGVSVGDFSQVELRVVAARSLEPALLDAFSRGVDVHAATACKMFKVSLEEVSTLMRTRAKAVNFGLLFGMTEFGLARELKCSVDEALVFLHRHQDGLPVLTKWIQDQRNLYANKGKVSTQSGRTLRYLEWQNTDPGLSVDVQGTAAEMMRAALVGLEEEKLNPLLQVHDEAVCKGRGNQKKVAKVMQDCAENAFPHLAELVSFPCDAGDGDHWAEAH